MRSWPGDSPKTRRSAILHALSPTVTSTSERVLTRRRAEIADLEWRMERHQAEQVACPRCEAPPGQTCRNPITGDELNGPPAHFQRIDAARPTGH